MYNLLRCKNEDGSSTRKKNALKRLKGSLKKSELTNRFSGSLQNVSFTVTTILMVDLIPRLIGESQVEKSPSKIQQNS